MAKNVIFLSVSYSFLIWQTIEVNLGYINVNFFYSSLLRNIMSLLDKND